MTNPTTPTPSIVFPTVPVTDSKFTYARGADVQATWRRFGWVPPSEGRFMLDNAEKNFTQTSPL